MTGLVENPHRLCRMRALSEQRTQRRLRNSLEYFRTTGVISYYRVYNRLLPDSKTTIWPSLFFHRVERGGTMPQRTFKLKTSTLAILSDDQRTMVTIPASALVALVVGDIDENGFVEVRYRDQLLIMFAEGLCCNFRRPSAAT